MKLTGSPSWILEVILNPGLLFPNWGEQTFVHVSLGIVSHNNILYSDKRTGSLKGEIPSTPKAQGAKMQTHLKENA